MADYCLSLICEPDVAEKLLDTLLATVPGQIFTSTPTFSHGTPHGRLTRDEQVMGRSRSLQIQLVTTEQQLADLIAQLRRDFPGTGLCFWATELKLEGVIE